MKILRIVSSGYEQGGVENGIVLMQPIFESHGHTVKIFSSDDRLDLPHFNHYTYKSPRGLWGRFFYTWNPYAYSALKKVLKEFNPDVVCIHTIGNASPSVLFAVRKYPTVYTIHGPEIFLKSLMLWCFPKKYFTSNDFTFKNLNIAGKIRFFYQKLVELPIYWFGLKSVNKFITLSGYMHKLIEEDGIKNMYVPYGTTLMKYSPLPEKLVPNIVFAGRLESYKGVDYLIKALPEIVKKFPGTHLFIAGEGTERKHLENLTYKLGLKNHIIFLGHLNRNDLEELYGKSSVVVVPSIWVEAFGKIGIEAMSVGRPVIASDVGGITDWLKNGKNGFVVAPKDSKAIEDRIVKLFENSDLLKEFSKNARESSENFDLSVHVVNMEKIYQEVIEARKSV